MGIVIEVKKNKHETSGSLLRRFSRRVQGASILRIAKRGRWRERPQSDYSKKRYALKRIERGKEIEELRKLGKLVDVRHRKSH